MGIALLDGGPQFACGRDVATLAALVAADQQQIDGRFRAGVVHAVARSIVYPNLEHPVANGLVVAEIALRGRTNPMRDSRNGLLIPEGVEPRGKLVGLADGVHAINVA